MTHDTTHASLNGLTDEDVERIADRVSEKLAAKFLPHWVQLARVQDRILRVSSTTGALATATWRADLEAQESGPQREPLDRDTPLPPELSNACNVDPARGAQTVHLVDYDLTFQVTPGADPEQVWAETKQRVEEARRGHRHLRSAVGD